MPIVGTIFVTLLAFLSQGISPRGVTIINTGDPIHVDVPTRYAGGPDFGEILNRHYFPGLVQFAAGRYREAESELTYFIERPHYIEMNPRQAEFRSTAHFMRGKIFFYHATGVGRYSIAVADFMEAIKLNPNNHTAYLELAKVYSSVGLTEQSIATLKVLLALDPEKEIKEEAQKQLSALESKPTQPPPPPLPSV